MSIAFNDEVAYIVNDNRVIDEDLVVPLQKQVQTRSRMRDGKD